MRNLAILLCAVLLAVPCGCAKSTPVECSGVVAAAAMDATLSEQSVAPQPEPPPDSGAAREPPGGLFGDARELVARANVLTQRADAVLSAIQRDGLTIRSQVELPPTGKTTYQCDGNVCRISERPANAAPCAGCRRPLLARLRARLGR